MIALNPNSFGAGTADMERLFDQVAAEYGARLPGERRLANRQAAAAQGPEALEG